MLQCGFKIDFQAVFFQKGMAGTNLKNKKSLQVGNLKRSQVSKIEPNMHTSATYANTRLELFCKIVFIQTSFGQKNGHLD